jgi:hypothetical protein
MKRPLHFGVLCTVTTLCASLGASAFAGELAVPFASFEPGVEKLEYWKPYRFGQGSSFERIHTTKIARTGSQALALSVSSGGGGQGVLVDIPFQGIQLGSEITFGAQVRLDQPGDLADGSINLHVELMAGDKSILRSDKVGSSLPVNAQNATTVFSDVQFRYRVEPDHLPAGYQLSRVTAVRLVIVALQPVVAGPQKKLGTLFIDDVVATVTAP